jgi:3-methyladenine DNA glycosylase AlkD
MTLSQVLRRLKAKGSKRAIEGMARYGITSTKAYGVSAPDIRNIAREIGTDHALSLRLWSTGILEARAVATLIGDSGRVTERQMERWVKDLDSWAVCDACCGNLFDKTSFAYRKAHEWSKRDEEFVKRAGFTMMAELAAHDKGASDRRFLKMLPAIKRGSTDARNFVKKAVNWALRQIGKRNRALNRSAVATAREISSLDSSAARWVAADALRELLSTAVQHRLRRTGLR